MLLGCYALYNLNLICNLKIWIKEIAKYGEKIRIKNVQKPFNYSRFVEPFEIILQQAYTKTEKSFLIINFGAHLLMSMNFTEYRIVLQKFIERINCYKATRNQRELPQIIWRTQVTQGKHKNLECHTHTISYKPTNCIIQCLHEHEAVFRRHNHFGCIPHFSLVPRRN